MAAAAQDEPPAPPTFRTDSPAPGTSPTPALGGCPGLTRCLSTASSLSHGSATTDGSPHPRESLGSDLSALSRQSSGSYAPPRRSDLPARDPTARYSTMSIDRVAAKRRGYMRPHGTDFAASARSRESVLSLGSIAHLQYYFARTGLLDGKGAQLARKRQQKAQTLDLSQLDPSSFLSPGPPAAGSDTDSSYASMGSSPDLMAHAFGAAGGLVESPTQESHADAHADAPAGEDEWFMEDLEESDQPMLPPTTSTYNHREKPVAKPPTIEELKADLAASLGAAACALDEIKTATDSSCGDAATPSALEAPDVVALPLSPGWCEVQGMHILDVMTLAIRAAKVYYTSHEHPDRLDAIRPEKEVRSDLLAVMDVLKRMASRGFAGGIRDDEARAMESWIAGLKRMLTAEEDMEAAERAERAGWRWLRDPDWPDPSQAVAREHAFLLSMLDGAPAADGLADEPLPPWAPIDRSAGPPDPGSLPTPFLRHMQNGLRLIQLHNCAVRKSRRRFGAIPAFHVDTMKPYRCADNIRYWVKAAELRWEVLLKVDALGVVYGTTPDVWIDFEDAILKWCRTVREEIAAELID